MCGGSENRSNRNSTEMEGKRQEAVEPHFGNQSVDATVKEAKEGAKKKSFKEAVSGGPSLTPRM
jgi:hypothetical protein